MATTKELIEQAVTNSSTKNAFKKSYTPFNLGRSTINTSLLSRYGFNQDLDTSNGLYNLAQSSGLQDKADGILGAHSGEEANTIFQGGFISDFFDLWNVSSYGVVGMLKGKTFMEGVENRESFSDQDALGKYGLMGTLAGIALDIGTDPMTYVSPWKVLGKIPGIITAGKAIQKATVGQKIIKNIEGTELAFTKLEGGIKPVRELFEKVVWMFGADPVFKETYERMIRNKGVEVVNARKLVSFIERLDPKIAKNLLNIDDTGRFARKSLTQLQGELGSQDFNKVKPIWDKIDSLSKQLSELGVLGKEKFEETVGAYLRNSSAEYALAVKKNAKKFGFKQLGITATEVRKGEAAKDLIAEPAYLLFDTMLRLIKNVEDAKLFKAVSARFGTDVAQEGFTKLADVKRLKTSFGAVVDVRKGIDDIDNQLNPLFKELRKTFEADKKVLSEIEAVEKEIISTRKMEADELTKFFGGDEPIKIVEKSRKLGIIEERFEPLANAIKKFDTYEEFIESKAGFDLQKLWSEGVLERHGFSGDEKVMREFFDTVKQPFKAGETKLVEKIERNRAFIKEWGFGGKDDIVHGVKRGEKIKEGKDISGLPLKSRILQQVRPEPDKIFVKELSLLKSKIINLNKGFRAGRIFTKKQIRDTQRELIRVIQKNFRIADRGKFIRRIVGANNPSKMEDLVIKLEDDFLGIEERLAEKRVAPHLKKAIEMQKRVENLLTKGRQLTELEKRSIDDSFRALERQINELQFSKEDLLEMIHLNTVGDLAGKYVPDNIATYIDEVINPSEAYGSKIMAEFKFMKVVMSPGTHVKNLASNPILNWWKLGMGPWRLDRYAEAIKEIKNEGKFFKEATSVGLGADTMAANELKGMLDSPEMLGLSKNIGTRWQKTKKFFGNIYQQEENFAKMAAFIHHRKNGVGIEEAWKAAESATFNYAQVTPFIRKMRTAIWGVPFITFPLKATPIAIETALKHPRRVSVFGKIKNSMEKAADIKETERERASEPAWVKDGFYVKLPWKDEHGRSPYFDLTYIIPLGDILSGQLFERPIQKGTGVREIFPVAFASKSPLINFIKEISRNKTFTGAPIWRESDNWAQVSGDLTMYVMKTFSPPQIGAQLPVGYDKDGNRLPAGIRGALGVGKPNQGPTTRRDVSQELFSYLGLKVQPIDADINEQINEYNKVKGLRTLLEENGVVKSFSKSYIPKQ